MRELSDGASERSLSLSSQLSDFARGAIHSGIENPVNGAVQVLNHAAGAHLPEMSIVGAPERSSLGATAGSIFGTAADFYFLSKIAAPVFRQVGGSGMAGTALRSGIVGGVYEGILQPSDEKSKTFFKDRLTNGMIGASTFAAMGASSSALDQTGLFAVTEARSFLGSVAHGGLSGAAGGLVNAEASAFFKEGRPVATLDQFLAGGLRYGAFGAAFGAIGYGYSQAANALRGREVIQSNGGRIELSKDANGNPIKIKVQGTNTYSAAADGEGSIAIRVSEGEWGGTKMANGTWSTNLSSDYRYEFGENPLRIAGVTSAHGGVKVALQDGSVRSFVSGGNYEEIVPVRHSSKHIVYGANGSHNLDSHGRITEITHNYAPGAEPTEIRYAGDVLQSIESTTSPRFLKIKAIEPGRWSVSMEGSNYTWQGDITQVKGPGSETVNSLQFTPKGGKPVLLDSSVGVGGVANLMEMTGSFEGLAKGEGYVRADANGNIFLSSGKVETPVVNGQEIAAGKETAVRPGQPLSLNYDIRDWNTTINRQLPWGTTSDGTPTIAGVPIKPNKIVDLTRILRVVY